MRAPPLPLHWSNALPVCPPPPPPAAPGTRPGGVCGRLAGQPGSAAGTGGGPGQGGAAGCVAVAASQSMLHGRARTARRCDVRAQVACAAHRLSAAARPPLLPPLSCALPSVLARHSHSFSCRPALWERGVQAAVASPQGPSSCLASPPLPSSCPCSPCVPPRLQTSRARAGRPPSGRCKHSSRGMAACPQALPPPSKPVERWEHGGGGGGAAAAAAAAALLLTSQPTFSALATCLRVPLSMHVPRV